MKKLFSEIPYIKGHHVVLKKITQDDAPTLDALRASESVWCATPSRRTGDMRYRPSRTNG